MSKFRRGGRGRGHLYATHYHAPPRDEVSSFSQTQIWSPYIITSWELQHLDVSNYLSVKVVSLTERERLCVCVLVCLSVCEQGVCVCVSVCICVFMCVCTHVCVCERERECKCVYVYVFLV